MNKQTSIKSLLQLLDDPDLEIYTTVELKLLEFGLEVLKDIPKYVNESELYIKRIELLKSKIIHTGMLKDFRHYVSTNDELDLEEGAFLLSQVANPLLQINVYKNVLNEYARDLTGILATDTLTIDMLEKISKYLFEKRKFIPNTENYHNLSNHLIDQVLETKLGIPLSLSFIYMFVAKRLNIPLKGIGLPGHFIVSLDVFGEIFYIDPFSYGKILKSNDCKILVERSGFKFHEDYFEPVTVKQMLERMIRNMISSYEKQKNNLEAQNMLQYIDILHWKY